MSRFGAALGFRVTPDISFFTSLAQMNSPKKAHFFEDIARVEWLFGACFRFGPRSTPASVRPRREAMQCVILAGGRATRMRPLTDTIPKALIPVDGRPFVDHQLAWLAGARRDRRRVVRRLPRRRDPRASWATARAMGCASAIVDEGEDLRGTAGALRLALDEGALEESFLLTYGDSFLPDRLRGGVRAFAACGQPALMTVFRNDGRWDTSNVDLRRPDGHALRQAARRRGPPRTSRTSTTASARWSDG